MLQLTFPATEFFDERTNSFVTTKPVTLNMEHSLISISKWESKWCKPFLGEQEKTPEEMLDYFCCMVVTPTNFDPAIFSAMTENMAIQIKEYIEAPMTATWINKKNKRRSRKIITSEVIYYWMVALEIPFECQKWHLNRLLMLVDVCNEENSPKKNMKRGDIAKQNRSLNAARKAKNNSHG